MDENWEKNYDQERLAWYYRNIDTNETRWAEVDDDDNAGDGAAEEEEEAIVDEYRRVYVVRYEGGGPVFKHWALYVEDNVGEYTGFLCHLQGRREHYDYVCKKTKDPKSSRTFVEIHQVGYVDTNYLQELKNFAEAKRIHNEDKY